MNEPFRGGKMTPFEGGVRVPALFYDPSHLLGTAGREYNHVLHVTLSLTHTHIRRTLITLIALLSHPYLINHLLFLFI